MKGDLFSAWFFVVKDGTTNGNEEKENHDKKIRHTTSEANL